MVSDRCRVGAELRDPSFRLGIPVHAHPTEVGSESRLEASTHICGQRLARTGTMNRNLGQIERRRQGHGGCGRRHGRLRRGRSRSPLWHRSKRRACLHGCRNSARASTSMVSLISLRA